MRVKLTGAVTPADCAEILKLVGGNLQKIEIKNNFEYKGRFNVEDIRKELESMTGPSKLPLGLKTTFEYPRLPKGHVRLLKGILGGSHPMATLENHPLESAPAYTAISYAWGANETTRTVFLNNASFGISVHVLEALNQFSFLVPGSHAIWLDKICINQGDNGEKADQVARMRDIYMQAEEVIIWMGATAHSSDELIENMPAMLDDLRTITPGMTLAASSVSIKLWHALGHFYTRDWFRRLWVVQEALLAKNITVVCGSRHIDWDTLAKLTQNIFEARILPDILPPGLERKDIEPGFSAMLKRNKFRIMKLALNELPLYPFLELLDHARECQVGQPVDRIWAVIGLAPSEIYEAAVPLIDYHPKATAKYWETYINFVRVLLTKDPGLHVLALCSSEASLDELPSWCPNFNSTPACVSRIQGAWRSFRSGQSAKTRAFRKIAFGPDSYTLRVNGFRVDRVDKIVENSAYTKDNAWLNRDFRWVMELERKKAAIRDWERKCLRLARSVYGTPNNVPDAHWRTLILDHIQFPHKRCSGSDRKAYDMFIRWCAGDPTEASGLEDDRSAAYSLSMMVGTVGRPYISTKKGRVGLAPPGTQEGDVICIFYGSPVPYFLRFDESGVARLIGDGFVHGLMYGEALEIDDRGDDELIRVV
ncbi:heterokaryon incompatibility protein-domain-containing protein [Bisporella sp. PMI_857]|nr:heterokaryon incompatibility protein-domain-containing protein [Bisporella sp. PMI_857]